MCFNRKKKDFKSPNPIFTLFFSPLEEEMIIHCHRLESSSADDALCEVLLKKGTVYLKKKTKMLKRRQQQDDRHIF